MLLFCKPAHQQERCHPSDWVNKKRKYFGDYKKHILIEIIVCAPLTRLKNTVKFLFNILFALFMCLAWLYSNLIIYGLKMGAGQVHIVMNARPIAICLSDPQFPDSLKNKLVLVQEIRKYAVDSLGLNDSPNYTSVYDQQDKPAIWVLTACEPFLLKPKEWKFPVLGAVPYKGFFKKEEGQVEQTMLASEGFDTKLGSTSGWSTLGWFKDPILSNMLYQSEGDLAELIIHELTHSTIFIKNDVQHNENLANFVGETGAKKFLQSKFSIHSPEYISYVNDQEDNLIYNNYILESVRKLKSLYASFDSNLTFSQKKKLKEQTILQIVAGVSNLKLADKFKYFNVSKRAITCKNAFFMEFVRYDSQHDYFEKELNKLPEKKLRDFIQRQKNL